MSNCDTVEIAVLEGGGGVGYNGEIGIGIEIGSTYGPLLKSY